MINIRVRCFNIFRSHSVYNGKLIYLNKVIRTKKIPIKLNKYNLVTFFDYIRKYKVINEEYIEVIYVIKNNLYSNKLKRKMLFINVSIIGINKKY